jgi:hypothetical protein
MKISELEEAKLETSLEWEKVNGWERIVSEAVIKYPLAPRQARAILEVFGILSARGIDVVALAQDLLDEPILMGRGQK